MKRLLLFSLFLFIYSTNYGQVDQMIRLGIMNSVIEYDETFEYSTSITEDEYVVVVGTVLSYTYGFIDRIPIIIKLDENLNIYSYSKYDGDFKSNKQIHPYDIIKTPDGYAICGSVLGPYANMCNNGFLWTVDNDLIELDFTVYENSIGYKSLSLSPAGNFILVGLSHDNLGGNQYISNPELLIVNYSFPHQVISSKVLNGKHFYFSDVKIIGNSHKVGVVGADGFDLFFNIIETDIDNNGLEYINRNEVIKFSINNYSFENGEPILAIKDLDEIYIGANIIDNNSRVENICLIKVFDPLNNHFNNLNNLLFENKLISNVIFDNINFNTKLFDLCFINSSNELVIAGKMTNPISYSLSPFIINTINFFTGNSEMIQYNFGVASGFVDVHLGPFTNQFIALGNVYTSPYIFSSIIAGKTINTYNYIFTGPGCINIPIFDINEIEVANVLFNEPEEHQQNILIHEDLHNIETTVTPDLVCFNLNFNYSLKSPTKINGNIDRSKDYSIIINGNQLLLDFNGNIHNWKLYDVLGRQLIEGKDIMSQVVDLHEYSNGIYILTVPDLNIIRKINYNK